MCRPRRPLPPRPETAIENTEGVDFPVGFLFFQHENRRRALPVHAEAGPRRRETRSLEVNLRALGLPAGVEIANTGPRVRTAARSSVRLQGRDDLQEAGTPSFQPRA